MFERSDLACLFKNISYFAKPQHVQYLVSMKRQNLGRIDRIVRIAIAAVFALLHYTGAVSDQAGMILLAIAIVLLATSILHYCPLYRLFKLDTRKAEDK